MHISDGPDDPDQDQIAQIGFKKLWVLKICNLRTPNSANNGS